MPVTFFVPGVCQPAGSKKAFPIKRNGRPGVAVVDDCARSRGWKERVALVAASVWEGSPVEGPVTVRMTFRRQRPKGHFTASGQLTKAGAASLAPTSKPDVLKLARAVEDALSGIIYCDDAQTVRLVLEKRWARDGEGEGVEVEVSGG